MIKTRLPPNSCIKVTGKSVYQLYLILKHQMNGKYDAVKSGWRIKVSDAAYHKRRDKYFFEKLSSKYSLKELCYIFISNLVANQNAWIGEISDADALIFYREYIGRLQRMEQIFVDDIKNIFYFSQKKDVPLGKIFEWNSVGNSSYIFKLLQTNIIGFETFLLLDSFLDVINKHNESANKELVWSSFETKLSGYKKLLDIDSAKARKLFIETIKSEKEIANRI